MFDGSEVSEAFFIKGAGTPEVITPPLTPTLN